MKIGPFRCHVDHWRDERDSIANRWRFFRVLCETENGDQEDVGCREDGAHGAAKLRLIFNAWLVAWVLNSINDGSGRVDGLIHYGMKYHFGRVSK